jgi:molybdate transport system substrate-binding protein
MIGLRRLTISGSAVAWMTALVLSAGLVLGGAGCKRQEPQKNVLVLHVGGTMRPVFEKLVQLYKEQTAQAIEINAAGSGELLTHIEMNKQGDLFVCHDPFMDILMSRGLGQDAWTVAGLTPVIVVPKGNPKGIHSLYGATDPNVSLALTDPAYSTLGHVLPTIFRKAGIDLSAVQARPNAKCFREGGQAANAVKMRDADAAIVWNAVAHLRQDALLAIPLQSEHLPVPGVDAVTSATKKRYDIGKIRVTIATLKCSAHPEEARRFAEFAASPQAQGLFKEFGFTLLETRKEYQDGAPVK